jgi:RHS repeat-associated protein
VVDPSTGVTESYGYNTLSQPSTITYGSGGDTRSFGYDTRHRLTGDTLKTGSNTTIASIAYGYDPNSNLISKTTTGLVGAASNTYGYDQANRLTSWNNGTATVSYGYDDSGNRTQVGAQTYTYDARDELTAANGSIYAYTARGTLASVTTAGTTVSATDDAYGQTITHGTQSYTYDSLGRVLSATGGAAFAYSGIGSSMAGDGSATYSYDPGGGLVGVKGSGFAFLEWTDRHTDVVGQFTGTGTSVAGSASYSPLGAVLASTGMHGNLGYQSGWTDPTTSHVNMSARWYDPQVGQFTSRDTVSLDPVPNSASANPFAYVEGNPLTGTDPTGHCTAGASWSGLWCALGHGVSTAVTLAKDGGKLVWDAITDPGNVDEDLSQAAQDFKKGAHQAAQDLVNITSDAKQKATNVANTVVNAATHPGKTFNAVKDGLNKLGSDIKHTATQAWDSTVDFVKQHEADIASFVASTVVFLGCEAVISAATGGAGAVPGAILCGEISGAVGGMVTQGFKCAKNGGDSCSLGAFAGSVGIGVIGGAIGGALGGAVGGRIATGLLGKAMGTLGGRILGGAVEGAAVGAGAGAITGGVTYGLTCGSNCSLGGAASAVGTSALAGGIGGLAGGALFGAASGLKGEAEDSAPTGCRVHSFAPTTTVLMADGSKKPIKDVKVGDKVAATDTKTGETTAKPVTATTSHVDTDLTELTVADPSGKTATIHTTQHHPFWDDTKHAWVDAGHLPVGDRLHTTAGAPIQRVVAVDNREAASVMLDLTVADAHTFYVVADAAPLLVHNIDEPCGPSGEPPTSVEAGPSGRSLAETDATSKSDEIDRELLSEDASDSAESLDKVPWLTQGRPDEGEAPTPMPQRPYPGVSMMPPDPPQFGPGGPGGEAAEPHGVVVALGLRWFIAAPGSCSASYGRMRGRVMAAKTETGRELCRLLSSQTLRSRPDILSVPEADGVEVEGSIVATAFVLVVRRRFGLDEDVRELTRFASAVRARLSDPPLSIREWQIIMRTALREPELVVYLEDRDAAIDVMFLLMLAAVEDLAMTAPEVEELVADAERQTAVNVALIDGTTTD